ncbi:MAG: NADH-quinone oxidoreductase subunit NuoK [Anaerolineaceae bacterium]|nr:NADH-quinone oxidoreductase subunit NuoK [Anaerolineaceae bacterium]
MPVTFFLVLSAIMFVIGFLGVLKRRHVILVFMCLELMFNSANLVFVTFASYYHDINAQLFVFFVMAVAAAEVAVGLALMVAIFRTKKSIDVDLMSSLKG